MHGQRLALFAYLHRPALLADQLIPHKIFQAFDLQADCGLRAVQQVGRAGMAFDLDHSDKGSQKICWQVHNAHGFEFQTLIDKLQQ